VSRTENTPAALGGIVANLFKHPALVPAVVPVPPGVLVVPVVLVVLVVLVVPVVLVKPTNS